MSLRWISLSICGLILISGSAPALAQSCSTIRSQMGASASASNAETMQKQRQIAAIRALERQRSCTPEKAASGGLFNACRGSPASVLMPRANLPPPGGASGRPRCRHAFRHLDATAPSSNARRRQTDVRGPMSMPATPFIIAFALPMDITSRHRTHNLADRTMPNPQSINAALFVKTRR